MRKIVKVCLCGLLAVSLITGCGKKDTKPTTEETKATESDATKAEDSVKETQAMEDLTNVDNGTITLGEYKGIEVERTAAEVTDEEVDQAVQSDLSAHETDTEVEREAKSGDVVNIDFTGKKDGVAFDGGTAKGYDLTLGSNQFIPGFEEKVIGAKKGDKLSLDLTFPENYGNKDLAGKPVVFEVTINSVKEKNTPELNEAFVTDNTAFKTVDEYKADKKQGLLKTKNDQADEKMLNDIFGAIVNSSTITPKQEAIDANAKNLIIRYENQAATYGMDFASFVQAFSGMKEEDFRKEMKTQAEGLVKQKLVIHAIADKEGMKVSDLDRDDTAKELGYESADKLIETAGQYEVDEYVLSQKVVDLLKKNAKIKE